MKKESSTSGKYGFTYHIVAPTGLINDPNGLIQWNGQYHVFFQWNPYEPTHSTKHWGHLVSDDMISWKRLPVALESTDYFDKNGVYSGGAYAKNEELWLFYTGNVKDRYQVRTSYQCAAVSTDGIRFEKKGPLFEHPKGYTAHVRDPKVWYDERVNHYWMILGAQRTDETGDTIVYRSTDMQHWELVGSLRNEQQPFGYMWECPDIVRLGEKDVFIYSPQGIEADGDRFNNIFQTVYQTGRFTPEGTFLFDDESTVVEMDAGFEFYAPQTFVDDAGRVLQYAWMGTMPPEMEEAMPTVQDGWIHALTIPRELTYENGKVYQKPIQELQLLRQKERVYEAVEKQVLSLDSLQQEWLMNWEQTPEDVTLVLSEEVKWTYSKQTNELAIERTNWHSGQREKRSRQLSNPLRSLQVYMEASSLEVFVNGGEEVFSLRYFAQENTGQLIVSSSQLVNIRLFTLNAQSFIEE